jgi:hypothetical protein
MLIGIVVKNAIVLVDFINLMRERGYELYEAIAISGRSRLRPVIMNDHEDAFITPENERYCAGGSGTRSIKFLEI